MATTSFGDWLIKLSGEDLAVVKLCTQGVRNRFAFIGFLVSVIFIGCLLSAVYSFYNLFDARWFVAVPVAFFIGWMFNNIYTLLLYTLTPNLLTEKNDDRFTRLALYLRLTFIGVIALIMARPLCVFIFSSVVAKEARQYKMELYCFQAVQAESMMIKREMELKRDLIRYALLSTASNLSEIRLLDGAIVRKIDSDSLFLRKANALCDDVRTTKRLGYKARNISDSILKSLFSMIKVQQEGDAQFMISLGASRGSGEDPDPKMILAGQEMQNTIREKLDYVNRLKDILDRSSFFLYKIKTLSYKYPYTWLVDIFIIIVFLLPVYWKYKGRQFNEYFIRRKYIERKIVVEEYGRFKETVSRLLKKHTGRLAPYYESYSDPPFNTTKKGLPGDFRSQDQLLDRIYDNE